jgi:hypothetical protein
MNDPLVPVSQLSFCASVSPPCPDFVVDSQAQLSPLSCGHLRLGKFHKLWPVLATQLRGHFLTPRGPKAGAEHSISACQPAGKVMLKCKGHRDRAQGPSLALSSGKG